MTIESTPTTPATPTVADQRSAPVMPTPPSIHVRAVITWIAIFPLVAIGMVALAPIFEPLHPVLRALILTVIVVPLAVYLVVPRLMGLHGRIMRGRRR